MVGGVTYEKIDDAGLHISVGAKGAERRVLDVDTIVVCAGQEPSRELHAEIYGKHGPPLGWDEFARRYRDEMKAQADEIAAPSRG